MELRAEILKRNDETKKNREERFKDLSKKVEEERKQKAEMLDEFKICNDISLDKFESKLFFRFFKTFANNENYTIDVQKLGEHFGFDLQSMGIQQKTQPP